MEHMDRLELADFLRSRREALQPEDVGLPRGARRRTRGLRREEVAALAGMSADYYGRIEQARGPEPSEQMLAAIARGLRLSVAERNHLFEMAGRPAPGRTGYGDHVPPGLMRILDRLDDTPAQVLNGLAETLAQTELSKALLGDETAHTGRERSFWYRWFTDPATRLVYPAEDRPRHSRLFVSDLRASYTRQGGTGSPAAALVAELLERSEEFAELWRAHEVGLRRLSDDKRISHPDLGVLDLQCQALHDSDQTFALLVYTAIPGTEAYEKLQLLPTLGVRPVGR
jgi:transcriptional regulator with XRE-family HTH domain